MRVCERSIWACKSTDTETLKPCPRESFPDAGQCGHCDRRVRCHVSKRDHGARLISLLAFALTHHVANAVSHPQRVEAFAEHRITMQVEFIACVGNKETIILVRQQPDDASDRGRCM